MQKFAGKLLASIFGDQDGLLLIGFLPKGQNINAEYSSFLLVQLKDSLKEKRRGKFTNGVLFLHVNAPAEAEVIPVAKNWLDGQNFFFLWLANVRATG